MSLKHPFGHKSLGVMRWKMLKPFQDCRKACHQNKSDRNALFSRVMKYILSSLAAVEYILETKALPGLTTLVACWRVPTSDKICFFLAFFLRSHVFINSWILASLYYGSLISMRFVSKIIPRKDSDVEGPSSLSVARGTPSSAHKDTNVFTLDWHTC